METVESWQSKHAFVCPNSPDLLKLSKEACLMFQKRQPKEYKTSSGPVFIYYRREWCNSTCPKCRVPDIPPNEIRRCDVCDERLSKRPNESKVRWNERRHCSPECARVLRQMGV